MPLEITWSPLARARLQEIRSYVALDKSEAAERLATRIVTVTETLRVFPHVGRPGADPDTRELVIGGTPYIVQYRVRGKRIRVLTIWHGAQKRKARKPPMRGTKHEDRNGS